METMSNAEYRKKDGISASDLKKMVKSMATWKYEKDHPEERTDSEALQFGRAYHKLMLEPDDFNKEFQVMPNFNCSTKDGKEEYAKYAEEEIGRELTADERKYKDSITAVLLKNAKCEYISKDTKEKLVEMQKALYATPFVKLLIKGEHEKSFFWKDDKTGVTCKCRPDSFGQIKEQYVAIDLKTTENAETQAFMRDAMKFGYDIQAAHYCEGLEKKYKKPFKFIFIAQEKKAPYLVNVLEADPYFMASGREVRDMLLERYKECVEKDEWPGYIDEKQGIQALSVPAWIRDSLATDVEDEAKGDFE